MKSILFLIGTFNDSKWDANITETLIFFAVFAAVLKPRLNFKYFEKKDYRHTFCIFEITDSENVVREMSKKSRVRRCFNKQYGKRAQTLLKSPSHHLYHIHWSLTSKMSWKKSLNWVGKSPSGWHEKSCDCLLRHWLLMKSIVLLIESI